MQYYLVPCRLSSNPKIYDLEWPWRAIWRQILFSRQFFCGGLRKTHLYCSRVHIGHSRSSKVVDFGTNRKGVCHFLLVVNSNVGPILHRFWDTAAYWLKIANFPYPLSFNALARGDPFRISGWFFIPKTRVLGLSDDEDFVILACVVFTQCQRVTDGRTDGQTSRSYRWRPVKMAIF